MRMYHLVGEVTWDVGSCHDARSEEIDEKFEGKNLEDGIRQARVLIQKKHEHRSWNTDYRLGAELKVGGKTVWKTEWKDEEDARPAIPAQPARPAVPARFKEKILISGRKPRKVLA